MANDFKDFKLSSIIDETVFALTQHYRHRRIGAQFRLRPASPRGVWPSVCDPSHVLHPYASRNGFRPMYPIWRRAPAPGAEPYSWPSKRQVVIPPLGGARKRPPSRGLWPHHYPERELS